MKSFLIIILAALSISSVAYGQGNVKTGVGTATPAQTLEIGGASSTTTVGTTGVQLVKPTVRIDGLNSTNNTVHKASDGTNSLKRVYANQTGDLVLVDSILERMNVQQFGDAVIPNGSVTGTTNGASVLLGSKTFILSENSVVSISASFNVQFLPLLTDGAARVYDAYFNFSSVPSGSGISTTGNFGRNGKFYTNATTTGTIGDYMINPRAELVLPKGAYTLNIYGYAQGASFTASFASSTNGGENVIIIASPTVFQ